MVVNSWLTLLNGRRTYLLHPQGEGALPRVFLLQVQVCVEEDEVHVALQVLQAPQQQQLCLFFRFTRFDLWNKKRTEVSIRDEFNKCYIG